MDHRHLDYGPHTDIRELGPAAIDDLLERGDLEAWAPLAAAIREEPHGELADAVLRLCEAHPMYGTSTLWRSWIERLRDGRRPERSVRLPELRVRRRLTQREVGRRMGISQSDVSKLERRSDLRLSTLESFVRALGGRLELSANFGDERFRLRLR